MDGLHLESDHSLDDDVHIPLLCRARLRHNLSILTNSCPISQMSFLIFRVTSTIFIVIQNALNSVSKPFVLHHRH